MLPSPSGTPKKSQNANIGWSKTAATTRVTSHGGESSVREERLRPPSRAASSSPCTRRSSRYAAGSGIAFPQWTQRASSAVPIGTSAPHTPHRSTSSAGEDTTLALPLFRRGPLRGAGCVWPAPSRWFAWFGCPGRCVWLALWAWLAWPAFTGSSSAMISMPPCVTPRVARSRSAKRFSSSLRPRRMMTSRQRCSSRWMCSVERTRSPSWCWNSVSFSVRSRT